ncbi:hypothetical protein [Kitasatospora aureofaciens]|uniref:hypothetical protein n=1 Tax=Kitasatospora aureofaciens TaxID=1894 RepID=UPI001C4480E7|nr:hypothetical protein [Kitasatospora aureofaciens]MBV6702805.1 hypothetical protein [Kitasatospora aureofaciens]
MAAVAFVLLIKFLYGVGRNTTGVNANRRLLATDLTTPGGRANTTTSGDQLPVFGESSALLALDVDLPPGEPVATEEPASAQPATTRWDTGELNAMLVAGHQQYLAEQAALQQQQYQAMPQTPATFWAPQAIAPALDPRQQQAYPQPYPPQAFPGQPGSAYPAGVEAQYPSTDLTWTTGVQWPQPTQPQPPMYIIDSWQNR